MGRFKHAIEQNEMLSKGMEVVKTITNKGYEAYLVGGVVRDLCLGLQPKDVDVTTNCPMDILEGMFHSHDIGTSKDFGIITVLHGGFQFEVAAMRTDGEYTDGRRPDSIILTNSLYEDLMRRDFTVNAMSINEHYELIDPVGGFNDLQNGNLCAVGCAHTRMDEDYLRMLRAIRFAVRLNLRIDNHLFAAIRVLSHKIDDVAAERVKDELFKMADMDGRAFAEAVLLMDDTRLLEVILPEVYALKDVQEDPKYHPEAYVSGLGTCFDHTLAALRQNTIKGNPVLNMAILLHDVGKANTHSFVKGHHRALGHAEASNDILEFGTFNHLKLSNKEKETILFCAENHMKLHQVKTMKGSTLAKLVLNENWELLKHVVWCDDSCRLHAFREDEFNQDIEHAEQKVEQWTSLLANKTVKVVDGHTLMEYTGLKSGPELGRVLKEVTDRYLDSNDHICLRKLVDEVMKMM